MHNENNNGDLTGLSVFVEEDRDTMNVNFSQAMENPIAYAKYLHNTEDEVYSGLLTTQGLRNVTLWTTKSQKSRLFATLEILQVFDIDSSEFNKAPIVIHEAIQLVSQQLFEPMTTFVELSNNFGCFAMGLGGMGMDCVFNTFMQLMNSLFINNMLVDSIQKADWWEIRCQNNWIIKNNNNEEICAQFKYIQNGNKINENKLHDQITYKIKQATFWKNLLQLVMNIDCVSKCKEISMTIVFLGYILSWIGCELDLISQYAVGDAKNKHPTRTIADWSEDNINVFIVDLMIKLCRYTNGYCYNILFGDTDNFESETYTDIMVEIEQLTNYQANHQRIHENVVAIKLFFLKYWSSIAIACNKACDIEAKYVPMVYKHVIIPQLKQLTMHHVPSQQRDDNNYTKKYIKFHKQLFDMNICDTSRKKSLWNGLYCPGENSLLFSKPYSVAPKIWNKTAVRELAKNYDIRKWYQDCDNHSIFRLDDYLAQKYQKQIDKCVSKIKIDITSDEKIRSFWKETITAKKFWKYAQVRCRKTINEFGTKKKK